ncbi:hypothetical protein [Kitasatospora aureofaciens]|uniref:hypothetical protein n=1 Tax=Kitasatospora aureofaciens TaxID=1894 RepID=UPI000526A207|nr:hypothetical protein [Kitasatospora aureofaciens]
MTGTESTDLETAARRLAPTLTTIEEEITRLASYLGHSDNLDRITLRLIPHQTTPWTTLLRRHLVITADLMEQATAGLDMTDRYRQLPGVSAQQVHCGLDSAKTILDEAYQAVCRRSPDESLDAVDTVLDTMRQINQILMQHRS